MLFAIFGHDRNGALARRLEVRPQHLARIDQLVEENRIVIAGPLPKATDESSNEEGFHGSLIIGEFDSIEEARSGQRVIPISPRVSSRKSTCFHLDK